MRYKLEASHDKRQGPFQVSMRVLLLVPLLIQVTVMVGLAGWLAYRNSYRAVEHLVYHLLDDSSERFHSQLDAYAAIPPAVTQQNVDALELGDLNPRDLKSWGPYLARQSDRFPHVTYIYYGSTQGTYVGLHKRPNGQTELAVKTNPAETQVSVYTIAADGSVGPLRRIGPGDYDPRQRPWYRQAAGARLPVWTPVYEFVGVRPQLGISFVRPHFSADDGLTGVFGADVTVTRFEALLQDLKLTTSSEALLIQPNGTIIASSEPGQAEETLGSEAVAQVLAQLAPLDQLQAERRLQFRIDEAAYWVQVTPFTDEYGLQWLGISVLPEADITAEIDKTNRNTILLCLLALAVSTALSSLLAQRLNRPILRLGTASQSLAQGMSPPLVEGSRIREVDLLVKHFNQMTAELAQSRSQLRTYSHQLEALVERRTQALRQSEEKFAAAFQASPNGVAITTLETGEFVEVNERFADLVGRSKTAILGQTSTALNLWVAPYSRADYLQQLLTDGVRNTEWQIRTASGEIRTALLSARIIEVQGERCALSIVNDISDRKQAERALRQSQAKFQRLVDDIGESFVIFSHTGPGGILTYVSGSFTTVFGLEQSEILNQSWARIIRWLPEDLRKAQAAVREAVEQRSESQRFELRFIHPSGDLRTVLVSQHPVWDSADRLVAIDGIVEDITDRKRAQEQLTQQFERQRLLTSITNQIRQSLDIQNVYQTTAQSVGEAFGVSRCILHTYAEPLRQKVLTVAEYLTPGQPSMRRVSLPMDGSYARTIRTSECAVVTPDVYHDPLLAPARNLCRRFNIQSLLAICTSYQGKPNGFVSLHQCDRQRQWTNNDVKLLEAVAAQIGIAIAQANLLQQEQQQRQQLAQQNIALDRAIEAANGASQAKSEFLANMSHELRTPLNAILGFSHLMARDDNLTETQASNLRIINRSGEHLLGLINSVLDMSKIESGRAVLHLDTVHLHSLLTDIVDMFVLRANEKGLALTVDRAANLPTDVYIDAGKLRQILVNLLSNAIKSTDRGTVTLRAAVAPPEASSDHVLSFEVHDTGCGIRAEDMGKIFDAFVQSEVGLNTRSGTGLGLTITQKFIALMGGQLQVFSGGMSYSPGAQRPQPTQAAPEVGSCFRVTLPVLIGPSTAPASAAAGQRAIGLAEGESSPRILIAEDRWESSHLLQQLLRPLGFDVQVAQDGQAAIDLWRRWRPDLIWMDMRMPVMDGFEATQYIKAQPEGAQTIIIALTASSLERDRSKVMAAGCNDYVRKPFRTEQILEKMTEHLGVRYQYDTVSTPKAPPRSVIAVSPLLAQMPQAWVLRLQQAAKCADDELILALLDEDLVPQLAQAVQTIIGDFRYDILIQATADILGKTSEG